MRFIFELYDDKEYTFWHRHKVLAVVCGDIDRAWDHVRELYPSPVWNIAQISRPFDGRSVEQPVFDEVNGFLFSRDAIHKARTWEEAINWKALRLGISKDMLSGEARYSTAYEVIRRRSCKK